MWCNNYEGVDIMYKVNRRRRTILFVYVSRDSDLLR